MVAIISFRLDSMRVVPSCRPPPRLVAGFSTDMHGLGMPYNSLGLELRTKRCVGMATGQYICMVHSCMYRAHFENVQNVAGRRNSRRPACVKIHKMPPCQTARNQLCMHVWCTAAHDDESWTMLQHLATCSLMTSCIKSRQAAVTRIQMHVWHNTVLTRVSP